MGAEALLHAAVINNARWCDAVCRSHGYPGEFTDRIWISARHALPFYPNAISLPSFRRRASHRPGTT